MEILLWIKIFWIDEINKSICLSNNPIESLCPFCNRQVWCWSILALRMEFRVKCKRVFSVTYFDFMQYNSYYSVRSALNQLSRWVDDHSKKIKLKSKMFSSNSLSIVLLCLVIVFRQSQAKNLAKNDCRGDLCNFRTVRSSFFTEFIFCKWNSFD